MHGIRKSHTSSIFIRHLEIIVIFLFFKKYLQITTFIQCMFSSHTVLLYQKDGM